jgi:hypothetical protein
MEDLQRKAEEILGRVTSDTMQKVYGCRIDKLNQVINIDGAYARAIPVISILLARSDAIMDRINRFRTPCASMQGGNGPWHPSGMLSGIIPRSAQAGQGNMDEKPC